MKSPFWPSVENIQACIKTEAEELPESTLMAVHEPMYLRRIEAGASTGSLVKEAELLDHVVRTNRPTPIIGQSGFGKSHVIRWLDIHLRRQMQNDDWHIVRIPKNASLRHALHTLLDGLEGAVFDEARNKIESVGRELEVETVAQHLIVFVGSRLRLQFRDAEEELQGVRASGRTLLADSELRIRSIRKHERKEGLSTLLRDPYFNAKLISPGGCFYQIAKRFTEGSSDREIEEAVYELDESDLQVVSTDLGNLSAGARTYVRDLMINTSEESRQQAVDLLNECLNDACRDAFQQLFHFNPGSFQDLFVEIRRSLKDEEKTLFILVEDMATISAIEDVLIDSLMQEDVRDGIEVLCPLHSAIAVTTGYQGYERRKDTLKTRARYEWLIDRSAEDEKATSRRIIDFCGRYLNAARFGEAELAKMFHESIESTSWPGVWECSDADEEETAAAFGLSPSGFPLFPYNRPAVCALADRFCKPQDELEFNPRKILQHVLREPLDGFRKLYESESFPPERFADVQCPTSLASDLGLKVHGDMPRIETLAAIWGYKAESLGELASVMQPLVAKEFGFDDLARVLEATEPVLESKPTNKTTTPLPSATRDRNKEKNKESVEKEDAYLLQRQVDGFFAAKSIPQPQANAIRKALHDAIIGGLRDYDLWYGMKDWPALKHGPRYLIHVPFNQNNPPGCVLEFGSEAAFLDSQASLKYKQFTIAVLRQAEKVEDQSSSWNYSGGLEDYCYYKSFLEAWIPRAVEHLVEKQRQSVAGNFDKRLSAATVFDSQVADGTAAEKVNQLVASREKIESQLNTNTGLLEWDEIVSFYLSDWDGELSDWLSAYSINRHALEGDLVRKALRGLSHAILPPKAATAAQRARARFLDEYSDLRVLENCNSKTDFESVLKNLIVLVDKLNSSAQFQEMESTTTARKFKNQIHRVLDSDSWVEYKSALSLVAPFETSETAKSLRTVSVDKAKVLNDCLRNWSVLYANNKARLRNENVEQGVDSRREIEGRMAALIEDIGSRFSSSDEARA